MKLLVFMSALFVGSSLVANPVECFNNAPESLTASGKIRLCAGTKSTAPVECYQNAPENLTATGKISLCRGVEDVESRIVCYKEARKKLTAHGALKLCNLQYSLFKL